VGEKGFMGKTWDGGGVAFLSEMWSEVLRVLVPGAYLLAFGGTRTYHRLTCAIEDAGFEIADSIGHLNAGDDADTTRDVWLEAERAGLLGWMYGSGFPKHASKLKPAWEPIVMARKPATKATLLNIDACRLVTDDDRSRPNSGTKGGRGVYGASEAYTNENHPSGRWPANVVLDVDAAAALDAQTGDLTSGFMAAGTKREGIGYHGALGDRVRNDTIGDTGGASRFFYTAKASRSERERGLEGAQKKPGGSHSHSQSSIGIKDGRNKPVGNHHPTVKPVDLMRWLVRLVTPPNGLVLDPFTGSGTTGVAAVLEERRFLGIEREPEYVAIAEARIARAAEQGSLFRDIDVA
jgi:site-specific DNA-methyltransferase (adenine-specific)